MTDVINDDVIDPIHNLIAESNKPKCKVTLEMAESFIKHELYVPLDEAILARYPELKDDIGVRPACGTLCILLTKDGFSFIGFSSCVSPDNFNAEIGKEVAKKKALDKLFEALTFAMVTLKEV